MMIDTLLLVHKFFYGHNNRYHYKSHNKIKWIVCNVMAASCCYLIYILMNLRKCLGIKSESKREKNHDVIISLTSYPARIKDLWMVIDSLMRQTMRPMKIVLYLSEQDFPFKEQSIPSVLLSYVSDDFHIQWVNDNLMPHKKYFYAFHQYQDKVIITVDDDNYYRKDLIETLWHIYEKKPNAVSANTVTAIVDREGKINDYEYWCLNSVEFNACSFNYLAIGASGILYPIGEYRDAASANKEIIKRTCLRADDLWLKCQEILHGIPVAIGDYYCPAASLVGSQKTSLISYNSSASSHGNNKQWEMLNTEFKVNEILVSRVYNDEEYWKNVSS